MAQIEEIEIDDQLQPVLLLEPRPFRPFKSSEEYLWAMREDLADWLDRLYPEIGITVDNFFEVLETGAILCEHANNVRRFAEKYTLRREQRRFSASSAMLSDTDIAYRKYVPPGSFFARDNIHNFILFCRSLGIYECLLFETDDLVLRKNEKNVIFCLLEVARRGAKYGMPAPMLVQFEREIDREIAQDEGHELDDDFDDIEYGPIPQIITNDLRSLDEMVKDLVEKCSCATQFPMIRVAEGKYRIGDTKLLIYVRILRNHVMVRVGGGWDTLSHYLEKHDPCRCRSGHRQAIGSKLIIKQNNSTPQMQVTYERATSPASSRRSSTASTGSTLSSRKSSLANEVKKYSVHVRTPSPNPMNRCQSPNSLYRNGRNGPFRSDRNPTAQHYTSNGYDSLESYDSGVGGNRSSDTSSDVSDEGYKNTERKGKDTTDESDRPESSMTHASTDSSGLSSNEPTSPRHVAPPTNWKKIERSDSAIGDDLKRKSRIPKYTSQRVKEEMKKYGIGRSSSAHEVDGLERTFSRSQVGRGGSFRMPKKPEVSNSSRNRTLSGQTWSGRKSGERSRITEDTFSYSTNTSPKHRAPRATSASPHPQRRTTKSVPTTPTGGNFKSPILRDLNNIDLEDDQIILKKMEEIINAYKLITERNSTPSEKLSRTCDGRPPVPRSRADSISKSRARSSSVSQSETLPRCSSSRGNSPKLAQPSCKENQNSPRPRRHSIQDEATPLFRRESGLTPSKIPIPVFRLE
ncbi:GAS2-like protein pickled eggs [Artemia franciscana]|uniref:GAS2-like protein pickled eggs n=1 Tax=Artemia franciscana TaxID=6661 RepID=A0AA88L260_ARTSF|nr:hypothetical protein QYM36_011850 [Artemia franciscana]